MTVTAPDYANRLPSSWLNYRGDRRHLVTDGTVLGPNAYDEQCHPVIATYDPEANRTRVGISNIAPTPTVDAFGVQFYDAPPG